MAIDNLKTDYKNWIPQGGKRQYQLQVNAQGFTEIEDKTVYEQEGDNFGANDINAQNDAINNRMRGGIVEKYSLLPRGTSNKNGYIYTVLNDEEIEGETKTKGTYRLDVSVPEVYGFDTIEKIEGTLEERPMPSAEYLGAVYYATDLNEYYEGIIDETTGDYAWNTIEVNEVAELPEGSADTVNKFYLLTTDDSLHKGNMTDAEYDYVKIGGLDIDESRSEATGFLQRVEGGVFIVSGGITTQDFHYVVGMDNGKYSQTGGIDKFDCWYEGDNRDFTPMVQYGGVGAEKKGSWLTSALYQDFMKPCVIAHDDEEPKYYLNKDMYSEKENGGGASILTGADGDVMLELKNFYVWFEKLNYEGSIPRTIKIHISNRKLNNNYQAIWEWINDNGSLRRNDKTYIGVYTAQLLSGVIASISGVSNLVNITRDTFISYCQQKTQIAKNAGLDDVYNLDNWRIRHALWILSVLFFQNKNLRGKIGEGRVKTNNTSAINTGTMNNNGFFWGDSGQVNGVKCCGIENLWGNIHQFDTFNAITGVAKTSGNMPTIHITNNPNPNKFNQSGIDYEIEYSEPISWYQPSYPKYDYVKAFSFENMNKMSTPLEYGASISTYQASCRKWYDPASYAPSGVMQLITGGVWADAVCAGLLYRYSYTPAIAYSTAGGRLCRYR